MKVAHALTEWRSETRPLCVAIGVFDGVHRGHARVIAATQRAARKAAGDAWVLTFDPHPARLLRAGAAPRLLTSLPHKLRMFERLDLDGCMVLPFTRDLAALPPRDFLETLRLAAPTLRAIFVGRNWRFGKDRAGTPALLARYARKHGITVHDVAPVSRGGHPVSSTRVRTLVQHGSLTEAAAMLGRPFSVMGPVRHGNRLGRRLGYATANLDPDNEVLPPYGIYAVFARIGRELREGVVSYGVRPTVYRTPDAPAVLELHVFDFAGNLYGQELEVFFVRRLRDEQTFESLEALCARIERDVADARRILATAKCRKETLYSVCGAVL